MMQLRLRSVIFVAVMAAASRVGAQPVDPYAPAAPAAPPPKPAAPTADPVLDEQVAQQLVARAQELLDAHVYQDAKQLAVEALVKAPRGAAAEHARYVIKAANQALGITDADLPSERPPPVTPPPLTPPVKPVDTSPHEFKPDLTPIDDPTLRKPAPPSTASGGTAAVHRGHDAAAVHGGLEGGLVGAMIGSLFASGGGGAVASSLLGVGGAAAGAYFTPKLFDHFGDSEAKVRTIGSFGVWGAMIGGAFTDVVTGSDTSARQIFIGSTIGSVIGIGIGAGVAHQDDFTRGDIALVDTFAGIGFAGGFTVGMLMQPVKSEAYSLNAVLGGTAGFIVGLVEAPKTNTTPRRMLRVAAWAAGGGAWPFLLYAAIHTDSSTADERITGLLSSAGMIVGAYIGFRLTEHMDEGMDVKDGAAIEVPDAPAAAIGRNSDGSWSFGGLGVQPLSPALASPEQQKGMTFSVVSGAW